MVPSPGCRTLPAAECCHERAMPHVAHARVCRVRRPHRPRPAKRAIPREMALLPGDGGRNLRCPVLRAAIRRAEAGQQCGHFHGADHGRAGCPPSDGIGLRPDEAPTGCGAGRWQRLVGARAYRDPHPRGHRQAPATGAAGLPDGVRRTTRPL
jgi:hypothetical protein